jgi:N-acetylmuramic acid 6-phosphate etherase
MTTERRNPRSVDIDLFPTERILRIINAEDALVAAAVEAAIPDITKAVDIAVDVIRKGGHVIYVGAGTSGRLAVLDSVECPPTFSTPPRWVQAVLAGGNKAFGQAIENGEDDTERAIADICRKRISRKDLVIGITASGTTPYTKAALDYAKTKGARTVAVVTAPDCDISRIAELTICTPVGPEIITGSTRMKSGTAQKLVLNMISTTLMIRLGMTYSNWMINVSMTNKKLRERGIQILREILGLSEDDAANLAEAAGLNLKVAVVMGATGCLREEAEQQLATHDGNLRKIVTHIGNGRE